MTGFEGIAAAIGVAELGLRGISRVYEFVRDMKDAPGTVIRLLEELLALKSCMSILASLGITGPTVPPALQDLQISATVDRCGETCSSLEKSLRKWTHGGQKTLVSRLRVRINKSQIDSAILSISSTKETINLAVTIASYGLTKDMSSLNKPNQPNEAKTRAPAKETPANDVHAKSGTKREQSVKDNMLMESEDVKIGDFGFDKPLQKQIVEENKLTKSSNAMIGQFSSSEMGDKK